MRSILEYKHTSGSFITQEKVKTKNNNKKQQHKITEPGKMNNK